MFSAGIADRVAVRPLSELLAERHRVVLPDIRGVGQSVCADPARHGWSRYVDDLQALLDRVEADRAVVAGAGMGSTIALRAGLDLPDRLDGVVAAGVEALQLDENAPSFDRVFPRSRPGERRRPGGDLGDDPAGLPAVHPLDGHRGIHRRHPTDNQAQQRQHRHPSAHTSLPKIREPDRASDPP